jgi:fatty acid desaturase
MIDPQEFYRSMQKEKLGNLAQRLTLMLLPLGAVLLLVLKFLGVPVIFIAGSWFCCITFVFVLYMKLLR